MNKYFKIDLIIAPITLMLWLMLIWTKDPIIQLFTGIGIGWCTSRLFMKTKLDSKDNEYKET